MRPAPVFGRGGIFGHLETFGQVARGRLHPERCHLKPRPPPTGEATEPVGEDATRARSKRKRKRSARSRGERSSPVSAAAHGITPWSAEPVMAVSPTQRWRPGLCHAASPAY